MLRASSVEMRALAWLLFLGPMVFGQSRLESFLTPSDSLLKPRRNGILITQAGLAAASFVALNRLWYADYPKSDFHFINDAGEWAQMDKAGHAFTGYQLSRMSGELLEWSGAGRKQRIVLGSAAGFVYLSAIEIFDGYSSRWGASLTDIAANAGGTVLWAGQEMLWDEQRISLKYSFHTTPYASARPDALGNTYTEQLVKDYNGQTYWLSVNLKSFLKRSPIPEWLNVAVGYGAEGMITGEEYPPANLVFMPQQERSRQFYLSLDANLTRIRTKSHLLRTVFSVMNSVKIPFPALEWNTKRKVVFRPLYF